MRDFYNQVYTDVKSMHFAAGCTICERKEYGNKIPLICRTVKNHIRLEKGEAGIIRQFAYNKSLAVAVQELAIRFNLCRNCGDWVCDDCFCKNEADGICKNCASAKNNLNETEGNV